MIKVEVNIELKLTTECEDPNHLLRAIHEKFEELDKEFTIEEIYQYVVKAESGSDRVLM